VTKTAFLKKNRSKQRLLCLANDTVVMKNVEAAKQRRCRKQHIANNSGIHQLTIGTHNYTTTPPTLRTAGLHTNNGQKKPKVQLKSKLERLAALLFEGANWIVYRPANRPKKSILMSDPSIRQCDWTACIVYREG
jgi:hypothetical protein